MTKANLAELEDAYDEWREYLIKKSKYPSDIRILKRQDLETFEDFQEVLSILLGKFQIFEKNKMDLIKLVNNLAGKKYIKARERYLEMVNNIDKTLKEIKTHISRYVAT